MRGKSVTLRPREDSAAAPGLPAHPPLRRVGVHDEFTQSGATAQIKERYGLSAGHVVRAVLG